MKNKLLTVLVLVLVATTSTYADINDARITELWVGRSGPDGTRDWLEVTNTGDTPIDTGDLAYDDVNPSINTALVLTSFMLMPGESAVFLIDVDAGNPIDFPNAGEEFLAVWVPFTAPLAGGQADGGLSQNGDQANLLDPATGQVLDSFTYTGDEAGSVMTLERIGDLDTDIRRSVLAENGAIEAQEFEDGMGNVVVDDNGDPVILVGSPGFYSIDMMKGLPGDVNCDGNVDLLDVQPFVDLIASGGFNPKADINSDGVVDLLDVNPFVALLTGT